MSAAEAVIDNGWIDECSCSNGTTLSVAGENAFANYAHFLKLWFSFAQIIASGKAQSVEKSAPTRLPVIKVRLTKL